VPETHPEQEFPDIFYPRGGPAEEEVPDAAASDTVVGAPEPRKGRHAAADEPGYAPAATEAAYAAAPQAEAPLAADTAARPGNNPESESCRKMRRRCEESGKYHPPSCLSRHLLPSNGAQPLLMSPIQQSLDIGIGDTFTIANYDTANDLRVYSDDENTMLVL